MRDVVIVVVSFGVFFCVGFFGSALRDALRR